MTRTCGAADSKCKEKLGRSFTSIRGAALTMQVTAQASGPVLSGYLRDLTGDYLASLATFAALSGIGVLLALLAGAPRRPAGAGAR